VDHINMKLNLVLWFCIVCAI